MDNKRITFKERTSAEKALFIAQIIIVAVAVVLAILNITHVLNFQYEIVMLIFALYLLLEGIFQTKHNSASGKTYIISAIVLAAVNVLLMTGMFNF